MAAGISAFLPILSIIRFYYNLKDMHIFKSLVLPMCDNATKHDTQRCSIAFLSSSTFQRKAKHKGVISIACKEYRSGQIIRS